MIIPGASRSEKDLRRTYSIVAIPGMQFISACIKYVEYDSGIKYLKNLKVGAHLDLFDFIFKTTTNRNACFIATDTGISPFQSILMSKMYKETPVKSTKRVFGSRNESKLLYASEMLNNPLLKWMPCLTQSSLDWAESTRRITHFLKSQRNDFKWLDHDYYLCGNGNMVSEIKSYLFEKGEHKKTIYQAVCYK